MGAAAPRWALLEFEGHGQNVAYKLLFKTYMEIREYLDDNDRSPFADWLENLRDTRGQARILARLDRVEEGLFGDHKNLGQGIWELRFSFGPGYRIYYGLDGRTVVLLLCGGDKSSQKSDIKLARQYWQRYCRLKERDQEL